jgi:hypothetical protein
MVRNMVLLLLQLAKGPRRNLHGLRPERPIRRRPGLVPHATGGLRRPHPLRRPVGAAGFEPASTSSQRWGTTGLSNAPAEREGFEPSNDGFAAVARLATVCLEPLGHRSETRIAHTRGGEGIRTPDGLPHAGFQNRSLHPLGHSSERDDVRVESLSSGFRALPVELPRASRPVGRARTSNLDLSMVTEPNATRTPSLRRERDSNPRYACGVHTLSKHAPSTARPSLQVVARSSHAPATVTRIVCKSDADRRKRRDSNPRHPSLGAPAFEADAFSHSATLPRFVGASGFEPPTPCPPDRCANQAALRPDDHAVARTGLEPATRCFSGNRSTN